MLGLAGALVGLPLPLYGTFVLEARFGFNRIDAPALARRPAEGAWPSQAVIGVPLLYAVYALMRFAGACWWLWLFGFLVAFQVACSGPTRR